MISIVNISELSNICLSILDFINEELNEQKKERPTTSTNIRKTLIYPSIANTPVSIISLG